MNSVARTALFAFAVALAVWVVYWTSLRGPFAFDDWHVISQNPAIHEIGNIPSFYTDVSTFSILTGNRDYRPLFLTSMALSWWAGSGSTVPFHLVGVSLHMGCSLMLFFILRRFRLLATAEDARQRVVKSNWLPFVGAVLFAVHPMATEPVNYISSQSVPMAAFFYLLSFCCFLRISAESSSRWRSTALLVSVGFYGLALLSKPIAITLPLNLLSWELLLGARVRSEPRLRRFVRHSPYWVMTLAYLLLRTRLVANPLQAVAGLDGQPQATLAHYLTQTKALVFYYVRMAVWPVGHSVDPSLRESTSLLEIQTLLSFAILIGLAALLYRFRRNRQLVFWALWFPICLLITTYAVDLGQVVREARMYLSLAGVCAIVAILLHQLRLALPLELSDVSIGVRSGRLASTGVATLIVATLAVLTIGQNRVWSSSLLLWEQASSHGENWRAHMNYGLALQQEGRDAEAFDAIERAVEMDNNAWSNINLGLAHLRRGNAEQGLFHLAKAVELWPSLPEAHYYHARGLEQLGQLQAAVEEFRTAIALRPGYQRAEESLATVLARLGEPDGAASRDVQSSDVNVAPTAFNTETAATFQRAWQVQKAGERLEAIRLYGDLLQLDRDHVQGTFNLAYAYLQGTTRDDWRRSAELFQRVMELDPDYEEAIYRLASALWKLEKVEEAARMDRLYLTRRPHPDLARQSRERLAAFERNETE